MTYLDLAKVQEQHRRLAALAVDWRSEYGVHEGGTLEGVVAGYLEDRKAIHDDCLRSGDPDDTDEVEMLAVSLLGGMSRAYRFEGIDDRLDDFFRRKPDVESSDELDFFKRENQLIRALDLELSRPSIGKPEFDRILDLFEGLNRRAVYGFGLDDGLSRTMSAWFPVAEAYLALAGGLEDVDRYAKFDPSDAPAAPVP